MADLITYVHGVPVRKSGVPFQQIIREYAKYVETGLTPEAVKGLQDRLDSETQLREDTVRDMADKLTAARMELEEYQAEGSLMLFRLLKNRYKNEVSHD